MNCWDWEFFETEVTSETFVVSDVGPLFGPITAFTIERDENLDLMLHTTSAGDSTTTATELPAGSVYVSTEEVKFESRFGAHAIASGVIPRSREKKAIFNSSSTSTTKQTSSIHSLRWETQNAPKPAYIIEWVENMAGKFLWPHSDDLEKTGGIKRTLGGLEGEVVLAAPIKSSSMRRTCVHLEIEGIELFVGESRARVQYIAKPGFILYKGTPDETTRAKIRDCLSFCLGDFLVYLGDTTFDAEWSPVAFNARSGHALVKDAQRLTGMQPAPLGPRFQFEVTPKMLGRMASSLYRVYDAYSLQSAFWSYWHALASPVHMTAAHFGAAIEGLQKVFFKTSGRASDRKIVADEPTWKELSQHIAACIARATLADEARRMLLNKAQNLNFAPQSVIMERFFSALGLKIGTLESDVWANRNRAAHGGSADADNALRLIRENKVLQVMMNRILLALGSGGDSYYDYYSLGRPTMALADPIRDDRFA
jgi:hypothetical protein